MRIEWQEWVKKLALAYETGWEYIPGSEEPGSVLMDIFLEMAEENQKRFDRIWEKQESAFQQAVPGVREMSRGGRGALLVKVPEEEDGRLLKEGTETYAVREDGEPVRFLTSRSVQLTSAGLKYVVYCKGLWAWLSYEKGKEGPIPLFQPVGEVLAYPVFRWRFRGLCDGRSEFCFGVDFGKEMRPETKLPGKWSVSDGERTYSVELRRENSGFVLAGRTPEFGRNFTKEMYEICLEILPGEELAEEWLGALGEGLVLTEPPEEREVDFWMTDLGAGSEGRVLPFGAAPEEGACCYFACDRIMAGGENEAELRFRVDFLTEERLPEPQPEEYKKLYRKYPWLQRAETVQDWRAEDAVWEYFNGNLWRILPDSEGWQIPKRSEGACEKVYRWKRPGDMASCSVEGEEHYYIRLRLRRVSNAYAVYYRKEIPVLEAMRFCTGGRRIVPEGEVFPAGMGTEGEKLPEGMGTRERDIFPAGIGVREEKVYLGFEGEVTCEQCWYTGEGFCFFDKEQLRGRGVVFDRGAFWVEMAGGDGESLPCFMPNYVPVTEAAAGGAEGRVRIGAGTDFCVESKDMGMLDAVCLSDICCGGAVQPVLSERLASKHYFAHFGRMLTPMDVELMVQERYPFLRVEDCVFREEEGVLEVELAIVKEKGSLRAAEELWEEARGRLREIEEWLEETAAGSGTLWLRGCGVCCSLGELRVMSGLAE